MSEVVAKRLSLEVMTAELVDTTDMPRDEWLDHRRAYIGGSDLATIMGQSQFSTKRDLFWAKKGIEPAVKEVAEELEYEEGWVQKKVGHLLEDLVAEIFTAKTGFRHMAVRKIFVHPVHKFMMANTDFLIPMIDGSYAILECKTANPAVLCKWNNNGVPINYELQCRHYLAILRAYFAQYGIEVKTAFIACLHGNTESDFLWRRIELDTDYEESIIEEEQYFWDTYVEANIEPPYTEKGDMVLESLKKHYGAADPSADRVAFTKDVAVALDEYLQLKDEKSILDKQVKEMDSKVKRAQAIAIDALGVSCEGYYRSSDAEYIVTYNPVFKEKVDTEALLAQYPEIYDKFVSKPESFRKFNLKRKELTA